MIPTSVSDDDVGSGARELSETATVLVAEDDADLRHLLCAALREDGYRVVIARDGTELLDRISDWLIQRWPDEQIDAIVSDVRMPGFTGTEILGSLRRARWDIPMILITAFPNAELSTQAARLGVRHVFSKPFDIDDLRTAVLNVVAARRGTVANDDGLRDPVEGEFVARPIRPRRR